MAVPLLDNEFMQYWSKLTVVEKESLLSVARHYVELKDDSADADTLRRRMIQEERRKYLQGEGQSYSWEQVKAMALNKDQRHVL